MFGVEPLQRHEALLELCLPIGQRSRAFLQVARLVGETLLSLGDGQVDFRAIFSKFAAMDFDGWAVVEWECALKHPEDGAREGAAFARVALAPVPQV